MRAVPLIALAFGLTLTAGVAEEFNRGLWERSLGHLRALPEQYRLEREMALEDLVAGVNRGEWTEAEAAQAKSWLQTVYRPSYSTSSQSGMLSLPVNFSLVRLPSKTQDSTRPIAVLRSALSPRFGLLFARQSTDTTSVLLTATRFATAQWVAARKPEDLQPARRVLEATLDEFREAILEAQKKSHKRPGLAQLPTPAAVVHGDGPVSGRLPAYPA